MEMGHMSGGHKDPAKGPYDIWGTPTMKAAATVC